MNNTDTPQIKKVLVHAKNEEDLRILKENFNIDGEARVVMGLMSDTQTALTRASERGIEIISTGLPVNVAVKIGRYTEVNAWDKVRPDGTRTRGCLPASSMFARKIIDNEAYNSLITSPEFEAAFGLNQEEGEAI